jgi:hypothetical protein
MLHGKAHSFLQHALLFGGIPSLSRTLAFFAAVAAETVTQLGFSADRFARISAWAAQRHIAARTPMHVAFDETACLGWPDYSAATRELVGFVIDDDVMAATSLRLPDSYAALTALFASFPPATKLFLMLLCPLSVHRQPFVISVFGATSSSSSSAELQRRIDTVCRHLLLATAGQFRVYTYAHDCDSGELGVTKRSRSAVLSAARVAASASPVSTATDYIRIELPRPSITAEKGGLITTRARLTAAEAHTLRRLHPTLTLLWSVTLQQPLPFLDFIHLGKCALTYLRSLTHKLRIGNGFANTICLLRLFDALGPRAEVLLGLRRADLLPPPAKAAAGGSSGERASDPMRWPPVERVCNPLMQAAVLRAAQAQPAADDDFQHIPDLAATSLFLRYISYSSISFLDPSLTLDELVYRSGWAFYFLHIWRQYLQRHMLDLRVHFLHHSQFFAAHANLQSLLILVLFWAQHLPEVPLPSWLLGSQWCEHLFRAARDLHDTPLFSPLQFLQRLAAIDIHQFIKARRKFDFNYTAHVRKTSLDELVRRFAAYLLAFAMPLRLLTHLVV